MAFVDELTVTAEAGRGGNGVVRWLHEKGKEFSGPSGGNGGAGGDVIFRAVRDLNVLARYRGNKKFKAEHGEHGKSKSMTGRDGAPVTIDVPVGSVITNTQTTVSFELLSEGETKIPLKGGKGGRGNATYKSSTNQYPTESTPGAVGEQGTFLIEVRLIADVGIIGMPNAGKTSLLNTLTKAGAKTGAYAFTTLEPNLGVFHSHILADIPGLIEGASHGKGLGDKFLRHIRRTRVLLHCISVEEAEPSRIYEIVRKELAAYDPSLSQKPEIIFLTKVDAVPKEISEAHARELTRYAPVVSFSIIDDKLIQEGSDHLVAFLKRDA